MVGDRGVVVGRVISISDGCEDFVDIEAWLVRLMGIILAAYENVDV